jgi:hypothetical protein
MGAGGGLATMAEAKLQRRSIKIRAHGGIGAACFGRGDACERGWCPGLLHRVAAAVCARAEEAVAAVGVATAEIAKNNHIWMQNSAAATQKAATAAALARAATPTPGEWARALLALHKRPQAK